MGRRKKKKGKLSSGEMVKKNMEKREGKVDSKTNVEGLWILSG